MLNIFHQFEKQTTTKKKHLKNWWLLKLTSYMRPLFKQKTKKKLYKKNRKAAYLYIYKQRTKERINYKFNNHKKYYILQSQHSNKNKKIKAKLKTKINRNMYKKENSFKLIEFCVFHDVPLPPSQKQQKKKT